MKIGAIVRAEQRGLGNLTRDFVQHIQPDKTLLVLPNGVRRAGLESHADWYPNATVLRYNGELHRPACEDWLDGLDVVWSAESFYDWRFCHWARALHVATVCLAMPEWCRPQWFQHPTAWWAPTTWRLDHLPAGTRHVPVPVSVPDTVRERQRGPFRWLHVAGAQTEADRNGTLAVLEAHRLNPNLNITIRTQTPLPAAKGVEILTGSPTDRWEMYDADALVLPRRYAGLSLPVLEAFGAGLPVVMTDLPPQNIDWPVKTVRTKPGTHLRLLGGMIETGDADPLALARTMDRWATDPDEVSRWRTRAIDYATANSWEIRAPQIRGELEHVADLVSA